MCGIAGIYEHEGIIQGKELLVKNMLASIKYRGPDESGIYLNRKIAIGSVRLSIIDLKTGQQPINAGKGRYWIVFNGEIFNYIELRTELVQLGYSFRTFSDTEVLLNAYIQFGYECLNKLNGQFVFAIWDNELKELFLARDRTGIRPLFYTWINETFIFGSEIKAIFEYPEIKAEIDAVSLSQVFRFWTTITPRTLFKGIFELSPGHFIRISNGKTKIQSYWSLNFPLETESCFKGSVNDAAAELEHILTDAVKIRLRADVQVAAYLSGGLDSGSTTALIKKVAPETLHTFSIGFENSEFDETLYQQETSDYLNTRHTAFTCTQEDIGYYFPQVVWHSEIPILRTAPVPMYCLSKKVRENNIKVVITGEGADEMLAGYDIFKEVIIREFWSRQPDSRYRPILLRKLYPYLAQFQGKNMDILRLFFGYQLQDTENPFYSHILRWKNSSNIHNFFSEGFKESLNGLDCYEDVRRILPEKFNHYHRLSKSQWLETVIFMSGYLLSSQGDRMAMANSVEGRYPFLDHRVIDFAATLPPDYKLHGLNEKYVLKKMMQGRLPEKILKRPKQAYRAPVAGSFNTLSAKSYISDILSEHDLNQTGIFSYQTVQKLINKIYTGNLPTEIENMALTGIISTQILYHQYIKKDSFRPIQTDLQDCRVWYEDNPVYF